MVIAYQIDPDGKFGRAIRDALTQVSDLTVPFNLIAKNWYQSNKAIFSLKGPGQYPPLGGFRAQEKVPNAPYTYRQRAEARKRKKWGFDYPLLKASGELESSLVNPEDGNAIHSIVNGTTLLLGTRVPWAVFHQSDEPRKKIPFRPFLFIGAEQQAPAALNNRQDAWINIIKSYVVQKVDQAVK